MSIYDRPTPETNSAAFDPVAVYGAKGNPPNCVIADFARRLEQERDALKEALRDMADDLRDHINAGKIKCEVCVGHVNNADDMIHAIEERK